MTENQTTQPEWDPVADMSLAAIEAKADVWAEGINLNGMLENVISPMRLNRDAPDDVRESFIKRMREQMDAIVRQAFIEGVVNAMNGFAPLKEQP